MVDGTWRPWDDDSDDDGDDDLSGLEAFDEYIPAPAVDSDEVEEPGVAEADEQQQPSSPLYTVTNPPGTVSVTVYLNGRIHHVELAAKVTDMSERELADEIRVIADLARQRARSELHTLIIEGVRVMGYDPAAMRDGLSREMDMPTPEEAAAKLAGVFSTRYSADQDWSTDSAGQGDR